MKKSQILVIIQFASIAFFLLHKGVFLSQLSLQIVEGAGIVLGLWAIYTVNPLRVSIFPEPRQDAELVQSGPYKWIRHPMYTAVLLVCAALAFDHPDLLDILVYAVLFINQWIKLRYEEALLQVAFPSYRNYMRETKALIPYFI